MNIGTIILAILIFSILIFIHEMGHFLACKLSKIRVNEFAIGMGPKLWSRQRGDTLYSIRAFPIGGFCAMEGEEEGSDEDGSFSRASWPKRFLVMVAGSLMNLLLGLLLVGVLSSQMSAFSSNRVSYFADWAVSNRQLRAGDQIIRMDGHRVRTLNDIEYEFSRSRDGILDVTVVRDGQTIVLDDVQFLMESVEGVSFLRRDFATEQIPATFGATVSNTFNMTSSLVRQVWGSLIDLVTGRYTVNQLSGPVGVTTAIGQATSIGWQSVVLLVSIITLNLGVFNLLPIPALDGGKVLFLLIELIRRKPVNPKYEGVIHLVGFALLLVLIVFVSINDVRKLFF